MAIFEKYNQKRREAIEAYQKSVAQPNKEFLEKAKAQVGKPGGISQRRFEQISKEIAKNAKTPHRFSDFHQDGRFDFGMTAGARATTSSLGYASRAVKNLNPFSVQNRQTMMNAMGLVTKNQIDLVKINPTTMNVLGTAMMPVLGAYSLYDTLSEGGSTSDFFNEFVVSAAAMQWGFRQGKAISYTGTKGAFGIAGRLTGGKYGAGRLAGGISAISGFGSGILLGAAAGMVAQKIGDFVATGGDNTNWAKQVAGAMMSREGQTEGYSSGESMTLRQRTLAKLSKSGLNDRGTILGNEASILRGMM